MNVTELRNSQQAPMQLVQQGGCAGIVTSVAIISMVSRANAIKRTRVSHYRFE